MKLMVDVTYSNYMLELNLAMEQLILKAASCKVAYGELDKSGVLWHERIKSILMASPEGMSDIKVR